MNKFSKNYWQKFSIHSKNHVFGPFLVHLPNFWGKKNFSGKSGSVTHNFIWISSIMGKFRKKLMIQTPGQKDGRMEGRTDRPYFKLMKNLVIVVVVYGLGAQFKKHIWEQSHTFPFWWTAPPRLSANKIIECPQTRNVSVNWRAHPRIYIFRVKWNPTTIFVSCEVRTHNEMCFMWIKIPQWDVSHLMWRKIPQQDVSYNKWKYLTQFVSYEVKIYINSVSFEVRTP